MRFLCVILNAFSISLFKFIIYSEGNKNLSVTFPIILPVFCKMVNKVLTLFYFLFLHLSDKCPLRFKERDKITQSSHGLQLFKNGSTYKHLLSFWCLLFVCLLLSDLKNWLPFYISEFQPPFQYQLWIAESAKEDNKASLSGFYQKPPEKLFKINGCISNDATELYFCLKRKRTLTFVKWASVLESPHRNCTLTLLYFTGRVLSYSVSSKFK